MQDVNPFSFLVFTSNLYVISRDSYNKAGFLFLQPIKLFSLINMYRMLDLLILSHIKLLMK